MAVKAAPADGDTLLLTSSTSHSINPFVFKKLPCDPMADFTSVGSIGLFPCVLAVDKTIPVRTPQEFARAVDPCRHMADRSAASQAIQATALYELLSAVIFSYRPVGFPRVGVLWPLS